MNVTLVLKGIALLSWLGLIGAIVYTVAQSARGLSIKRGVTIVIVVLIVTLALNIFSAGLVFIEPDRLGVVVSAMPGQKGVRDEALGPGLHWIVPYFESVTVYSISNDTYTMSIAQSEGQLTGDDSVESRTADGQIVRIDASVIFKINPARVVDAIHIEWQRGQYVDLLVRPQSRGVIRDAVAQYAVEEVYSTHREEMTLKMEAELEKIFEENGLILIDFVLRNIAFSDEYSVVIESKQIAEQRVLEEEFVVAQKQQQALQAIALAEGEAQAVVKRAEGDAAALLLTADAEAQARLIKAQAEAQALQLLGQAIALNPDVLLLEYIQKLASNINVMLLPSDNPFLLPLPELP